MKLSKMVLLILSSILTIPTSTGTEETNLTGNDTVQTLQFINLSDSVMPQDAEAVTRCMTESVIMRKDCSKYYYGAVIDIYNNWWVLSGSFFASFFVVALKGWYTNTERSLIIESFIYSIVTIIIVYLLVVVGINMYFLNYITHTPKLTWAFISFGFWGAVTAYIGDGSIHENTKKYKLRDLDLLTRLKSQ